MNEWEAKYKALAAGLSAEHIEAAEKLIEISLSLAIVSAYSFERMLDAVLRVETHLEAKEHMSLYRSDLIVDAIHNAAQHMKSGGADYLTFAQDVFEILDIVGIDYESKD